MEKFLLGGFLAGDELNIINEEQVTFPVFVAEFHVFAAGNGGNQLVGEFVALDINDVRLWILAADVVGDGIQQVGLTHAGRAVDEQGIIHLPRIFGDGDGGTVGKPVAGADHEIIEGELGVKVHGGDGLAFVAEGIAFFIAEHQELGIGIEHFL